MNGTAPPPPGGEERPGRPFTRGRSSDGNDAPSPRAAGDAPRVRDLRDFAPLDWRTLALVMVSVALGAVAAGVALGLYVLIQFFTNGFYFLRLSLANTTPVGSPLGLLAVAVPVIGGLLVGALARYGSPAIRGHGIPEAMEATLTRGSRMAPRIALLKPLASAIAIGTGGPFGAEGPIIMTGGAVGSVFGQLMALSPAERKTLLAAGAAAGMAATFNTPFAAVLLAVEVLLFEWRPQSLLPVVAAVATATVIRGPLGVLNPFFGPAPLFGVNALPAGTPLPGTLLDALGLGLFGGALAIGLTVGIYRTEDLYRRLPVSWVWWPAIGGLAVGVGGLLQPYALGVGYENLGLMLAGEAGLGFLLSLALVKAAVWVLALSSGTSGGTLAPLLIIGGSATGALALLLPGAGLPLAALIGMVAALSGAFRAPLTSLVFGVELTHDLAVLPVLLVASLAAYGLSVLVLPRSILTEKVARQGIHVSQEYRTDPLETLTVGSVMARRILVVPWHRPLEEALRSVPDGQGGPGAFLVVDEEGRRMGYVTFAEAWLASHRTGGKDYPVGLLARRDPPMVREDESVRGAMERLLRSGAPAVFVTDRDDPGCVVGILGREEVADAFAVTWREGEVQPPTLRLPSLRRRSPPRPGD
jgi:CIC family chloride channel protein